MEMSRVRGGERGDIRKQAGEGRVYAGQECDTIGIESGAEWDGTEGREMAREMAGRQADGVRYVCSKRKRRGGCGEIAAP
jgi:hypothetical protein